jgi:hypothetical protein
MKEFIKGIEKVEAARFRYEGNDYIIGPFDWEGEQYYFFQLYVQDREAYFIRFYKDKMLWYRNGHYLDTFMVNRSDYETIGLFVNKLQSQLNYIKRK